MNKTRAILLIGKKGMPKFFVNNNQISKNKITITGDSANHIKNVLRLKINDEIKVCDIQTKENYLCSILELLKETITCNIIEKIEDTTESNVYINIIQGLPKSDKMEWIIEKCTEIGVSEFTPLKMKRCVVKLEDKKSEEKKIIRWQKIAESAAMQSGRDIIPKINNILEFNDLENIIKEYDLVLACYEEEKNVTIKEELKKINQNKNIKIAVIIGPEGGISTEEIEKIQKLKIPTVTLGKRILRTETAPIMVSSVIMYELENI